MFAGRGFGVQRRSAKIRYPRGIPCKKLMAMSSLDFLVLYGGPLVRFS